MASLRSGSRKHGATYTQVGYRLNGKEISTSFDDPVLRAIPLAALRSAQRDHPSARPEHHRLNDNDHDQDHDKDHEKHDRHVRQFLTRRNLPRVMTAPGALSVVREARTDACTMLWTCYTQCAASRDQRAVHS
jgi:hypothetical protein